MVDAAKYYIFYDGDCGFCNHWVKWILKNDVKDQFLFSSLQSSFGQKFLTDRSLKNTEFDTLYLWKPNFFYLKKSQAVFKIARILGGKFAIAARLNIFPTFFSDVIYDQIAKNRTKLASQQCFLPNQKERAKFVE